METEREAWLKLTTEDALDTALPICDPHHHFWDHPGDRYMLDELLRDIGGGHNIVQTVFVQCGSMHRKGGPKELRPVGETEFVQGIAAQSASGQYGPTEVAAGIVGYADFTWGAAAAAVLEAHIAASRNRFRGIRQVVTWDPNPGIKTSGKFKGMMLDAQWREGFACLQKYGLSFDAWMYYTQLTELADLAKAFPGTTIIMNHFGGIIGTGPYAGKRDEVFRDWKRGMAAVAKCPNVYVKLGGFGMPRCGFGWHERPKPPDSKEVAETIAPYCHAAIELFGADRCMFESNFPVDSISCSYTVLWNAFKRVAAKYSAKERAALLHDAAVKAYRLAPPAQ